MNHRCCFSVLRTIEGKINYKFQVEIDCSDIQDGYDRGLEILSLIAAGDGFSWMKKLVEWVKEVKIYEPWYDYTQDHVTEKLTLIITYL